MVASFPADLWPAEEEETADGIYLRLKDALGLLEMSSVAEEPKRGRLGQNELVERVEC